MRQPWIKVNGRTYSHEDVMRHSLEQGQSDFEKSTLKFCRDWLNDQQEFLIQTSGSTGAPKPIVLLRMEIEVSAKQTIAALQLKTNQTALVCLDTKYIAGQMMLVRSLITGMNIVAAEPTSNPFAKLEGEIIDFVALVPYQLENIIEHSLEKLNQIGCCIVGGAAISHSLMEKIKKSSCAIYATYGMTETISHIALQRLNGNSPDDCFEAFPTIHLRLDNRGCLCIKTNYLKEELNTNDLVELMDERKFRWLGRIDNIINSGGIKVIPEKVELVVERILDSFQLANRFFVAGWQDEKLGSKVVVVFEGLPFNKKIQEEILIEASKELIKYELPKEFIFTPQFKETATGKINRTKTLASIN